MFKRLDSTWIWNLPRSNTWMHFCMCCAKMKTTREGGEGELWDAKPLDTNQHLENNAYRSYVTKDVHFFCWGCVCWSLWAYMWFEAVFWKHSKLNEISVTSAAKGLSEVYWLPVVLTGIQCFWPPNAHDVQYLIKAIYHVLIFTYPSFYDQFFQSADAKEQAGRMS